MLTVLQYCATDGKSPYNTWYQTLDDTAAARIDDVLYRMRLGNLGDHKAVGQGVFERRITFGPGYRVYFGKDGDQVVVLVGAALNGGRRRR